MDLPEFASSAARVLRRAVPFDGVAIVALDPATALPVAKWADNSLTGSAGLRLADIELHEPDAGAGGVRPMDPRARIGGRQRNP